MHRQDLQIWLYPEEISLAGAARVAELCAGLGVGAVSVALTYHQCMRLLPRYGAIRPGAPGGVHFEPNPNRYAELKPRRSPSSTDSAAIIALRNACDEVGLGFRVWIVALDNEALATEHQDYAAQTLDGAPALHALCPSHAAVCAYASALVADVVDQFAPELVELEAALYPRWNSYLTEVALDPVSPLTKAYGAQCLCDACLAILADVGIDATDARAALAAAAGPPLGVAKQSGNSDLVEAISAVRDRAVAHLVRDIRAGLPGSTRFRLLAFGSPEPLYLQGLGPDAASAAGEVLVGLGTASGEHLLAELEDHLSARYPPPTAIGLNWMPSRSATELGRDAMTILDRVDGLSFYNLSLLPDSGLEQLRTAVSMIGERGTQVGQ